jgi:predicted ribonuclease toxin of YeeF-YezG toxin-antitoxin module
MDVKYIPSDWEKMKDGIGDLIGLGRWGKGMIDTLKDLSENLEDAESDINKYDSDGVISFHHTSLKGKYQALYEDFQVLHSFSGKVGDIVDRTIDQPFYEDMDAFVAAMQEATISNYTTKNRIGTTETQYVYGGYGPAQSFEVPKTEVSLDDIFNGDNFYGNQMKLEYEAWKELNPDQDFSQKEYQLAAVNTRAFEYESIRNQQESKEFWVQLGALVVIVGVSLICPPAGLALGAAYGAMELSSAVSGKDWVSGRELGTGERWFRGLLAPLDIIPGVSGLTKFSSAVRLANVSDNVGMLGTRVGVRSSIQQGATHIDNMLRTAGQQTVTRLKSATQAARDASNVVKNKLARDTIEAGKVVDNAITRANNIMPSRNVSLAMENVGDIGRVPVENAHTVENKLRDLLSKMDGVNLTNTPRDIREGIVATNETIGKLEDLVSPNSFKIQMGEILSKHNLTFDEFKEFKLKPVDELTDNEVQIMLDIRNSVSPITKDTFLQKTIPVMDIEKYLSGVYAEIGGYVAKLDDVGHIKDYGAVVESSRLDYTTWDGSRPFPEDGHTYGKIKFKTNAIEDIEIPYGERLGGKNTDGPPCTLNGFTASRNDEVIPEWRFADRHLPKKGAELFIVEDGVEKLVGIFNGEYFVPIK